MRIIDYFIKNPSKEVSQTEIRHSTKMAKATLINNLAKLERKSIVIVKSIGRLKLYKLNNDNMVAKQLKIIQTLCRLEELTSFLRNKNVKVFLYGSAARGDDVEDSDIDIIVIGKLRPEEIISETRKFSEILGKDIRIKVFSPLQMAELSRKDKPFYERFEKDKIELC